MPGTGGKPDRANPPNTLRPDWGPHVVHQLPGPADVSIGHEARRNTDRCARMSFEISGIPAIEHSYLSFRMVVVLTSPSTMRSAKPVRSAGQVFPGCATRAGSPSAPGGSNGRPDPGSGWRQSVPACRAVEAGRRRPDSLARRSSSVHCPGRGRRNRTTASCGVKSKQAVFGAALDTG